MAEGTGLKQAGAWNYTHLCIALTIAFVMQTGLLPCLCEVGTAKIKVAYVFDVLMILRIAMARVMNQKDRGWIFYIVLIYSSPVWIEVGSHIARGRS